MMPGTGFRGVDAILEEREKQWHHLGFNEAHDDDHDGGSLAYAGATLALPEIERNFIPPGLGVRYLQVFWPHGWDKDIIEPEENVEQRQRNLAKAGALIAAEWERLDRLNARSP